MTQDYPVGEEMVCGTRDIESICDTVQEMIFMTDQNSRVVYANAEMTAFTGLSLAEMQGRHICALLFEDENSDKGFLELGSREIFIPRFNASFLIRNSKVRDSVNRVHIMLDVTAQKKIDDICREQEEYRSALIESLPIGAYIEQDGRFQWINASLSANTGFGREELLGRPCMELVYPDDRETTRSNAIAMLKGELLQPYEYRFVTKSKTPIWCLETVVPILYRGKRAVLGTQMNISVQKKAEEAIRTSEERYRNIIDTILDPYYEADLAGNLTLVNDALVQNSGYSREELLGMNFGRFIDETNMQKMRDLYRKIQNSGKSFKNVEMTLIRKGGALQIAELSGALIRNPEGKPVGYRGITHDITRRKRMEETLCLSEERFRGAIEQMQDAYYEVDLAGKYTYVNDAICKIYQLPRAQLLGTKISLQRQNEANLKKTVAAFQQVYQTGNSITDLEVDYIQPDGISVGNYEMSVGLIKDAQGQSVGFRGIIRDITQRKKIEDSLRQSEERYRTIIETIPEAYFEVDAGGNTTFCNDQYAAMIGLSKEDIHGKNFREFMDEENAELMSNICKGIVRTGLPATHVQFEWLNPSGNRRVSETSLSLIRDAHGDPAGFRGISRDVTEKLNQEVLEFQSRKLESVGQLAAGIAHEINTPIQFVNDNMHFMRDAAGDIFSLTSLMDDLLRRSDSGVDPSSNGLLQKIKDRKEEIELDYLRNEIPNAIAQSMDGLQRVSRIIQAMREFSHPGGHGKTGVDINKAIESTITLTRNEWKYSSELSTSLDADLPMIKLYPSDLNQVIMNLILNATQAIEEKVGREGPEKGRIEISTRLDADAGEVEIALSDTGPGIPQDIQSRIFDPFFTTKDVGKGTGQGLAIARNVIVKKHGGRIYFETKAGEGTTFYIRLPIDCPEDE